MDLFTIIEKKGKTLYHGTDTNTMILQEKPLWLAHTERNAESYGENVFMFKLKKDIKLIDISHSIFHQDFMYKVNDSTSPEISNAKFYPLLAIGLPNFKTQIQINGYKPDGFYPNNANKNPEFNKEMVDLIEEFVPLFSEKHRLSVQGKISTDKIMVDSMMKLYPDFDGYICKNYWPSYHHGGFLVPETCIFRPGDFVEVVGMKGGKKKTTKTSDKPKTKPRKMPKNPKAGKAGYRPNPFGGYSFSMDDFVKDTGIPFESMIRGPIKEY